MKTYTGKEYLYIDIANHFGLDKLTFEQRIGWVTDNEDKLEHMAEVADSPLLFNKAIRALREAQRHEPTGHMCGLDAVNSGAQIMSALIGCYEGAKATGLVDSGKRADAYKDLIECMNQDLEELDQVRDKREDVKTAFMTFLYGSEAEPLKLFGDTPAYTAFFKAMDKIVPGAVEIREALINAWTPYTEDYTLSMPDGFQAVIRTQDKVSYQFSTLGIPDAKYVLHYPVFKGVKRNVSMAANTIHA